MIKEYISFEDFDTALKRNIHVYRIWKETPDEDKKRHWEYIHSLIETHDWKGKPLESPQQESAFPRIVKGTCIFFSNDTGKPFNHNNHENGVQIIYSERLALATADLIEIESQGLRTNILERNIGIVINEVGPLKTEYRGKYQNTEAAEDLPMPKPLWDVLRRFSATEKQPKQRLTIRTARRD